MNLSLIPHPEYIHASLNEQALTVANNAHRNQKRWGGQPYIIHPIAVADRLPVHLKVLGYLHDVLEDNAEEYPLTRLSELFPVWVVERIVVLTKLPDENYDDYILRVAEDRATRPAAPSPAAAPNEDRNVRNEFNALSAARSESNMKFNCFLGWPISRA